MYMRGNMLSIAIKTFMREDSLFRLLNSIDQYLPNYKIYIADDSDQSGQKEIKYAELKEKGHQVILLPFDVGLSAGRNILMNAIQEPYILLCDDDFILEEDNGVMETLKILKKRPDIGIITGVLHCGNDVTGFENFTGDWEDNIRPTKKGNNFFIARKSMFSDVMWNMKYKINKEHADFFKRVEKTKWKVYFCPLLRANHENRMPTGEYHKFRTRKY